MYFTEDSSCDNGTIDFSIKGVKRQVLFISYCLVSENNIRWRERVAGPEVLHWSP